MSTLDTIHSRDSTSHVIDPAYPLYNAHYEHDACGTGFLAQISGQASHVVIQAALQALTNLTHRGAQDADAETSDGAGLLTQIPRTLLCEENATRLPMQRASRLSSERSAMWDSPSWPGAIHPSTIAYQAPSPAQPRRTLCRSLSLAHRSSPQNNLREISTALAVSSKSVCSRRTSIIATLSRSPALQ